MALRPDFGKTADDYAQFRAGFPDSMFERLAELGVGLPGQTILDLGTGTGTLARGFASRGPRAFGLDKSLDLMRQAASLARRQSVDCQFFGGRAEKLPFKAQTFDVVSAGQCWHWFDRPSAANEVSRVLRPAGMLVIAHFDWIPLPGNPAAETEELLEAFNPNWKLGGGVGIHPQWLRDVGIAGFRNPVTFSYDIDVPYSHEAWRGRIRASAGVGATLSPERVADFDAALGGLLKAKFPQDLINVLHRVFALVCTNPAR